MALTHVAIKPSLGNLSHQNPNLGNAVRHDVTLGNIDTLFFDFWEANDTA